MYTTQGYLVCVPDKTTVEGFQGKTLERFEVQEVDDVQKKLKDLGSKLNDLKISAPKK